MQDETCVPESPQLEYEVAPLRSVSLDRFFAVEYPGYVENVSRVLKTLGNKKGLLSAANKGLLELRYRPEDPFCHPINGDVIPTSNLLLRVTRRRKKRESGNTGIISYEILGVISKTCRFRGMTDFANVPYPTDPIPRLRRALDKFDVEGIRNFRFQTAEQRKMLRILPPALFTRVEWPKAYNYQQNSSVIKVMLQQDDRNVSKIKLLNRRWRKKFICRMATYDTKTVPAEPPHEVEVQLHTVPAGYLDTVKRLFEERPIWTRLALLNNLPKEYRKYFRRLVPLVAYWMVNGPWRDCWVKLGYDPKEHQEARIYQLLDVRNNRRPRRTARAKRTAPGQQSETLDGSQENFQNEEEEERNHVFDGRTKVREVTIYQMCDVFDPLLSRLATSPDNAKESCDERGGFYTLNAMMQMRKILRRKVTALEAGTVLSDDVFDDLLQTDASQHDKEDEGTGSSIFEGEDIGHGSGGETESDLISKKIAQLMEVMQRGQEQQDEAGQSQLPYRIEDLEEYRDIFGSDPSGDEEELEDSAIDDTIDKEFDDGVMDSLDEGNDGMNQD